MPFAASKPCDDAAVASACAAFCRSAAFAWKSDVIGPDLRQRRAAFDGAVRNEAFGDHAGERRDVARMLGERGLIDGNLALRHAARLADLVGDGLP